MIRHEDLQQDRRSRKDERVLMFEAAYKEEKCLPIAAMSAAMLIVFANSPGQSRH